MSFTSFAFWGELVAALGIFYLTPPRFRVACLLAISVAFILLAGPVFLLLLAGETLVGFLAGRALARATTDRARNGIVIASLVPILGALVVLKLLGVLRGILLPLGISYYTFKLISYIVECSWDEREVEPNLVDFASFVSFAPQMVAGPIQRPRQFLRQLPRMRAGGFDPDQFESGCFSVLRGLLLKLLIGDRLGAFIGVVDAAPQNYDHAVLVTLVLCYGVQLYADFAGYTLIAIGIGRLFGIESPPNFNAPFRAANIQDFWRRWHISLSSWIADYVFTPLSLSTRRLGPAGVVFSLFVAMILIGVWHGFTLTFLIYGIMQGAFMSVSALTLGPRNRLFERRPGLAPARAALGMVCVYGLMTVSQIVWRAPTWSAATLHVRLLARNLHPGPLGFGAIRLDIAEPVFACMAIALYHGLGAPGFGWIRRHVEAVVPRWVVAGVALLLLSALSTDGGGAFIYGQF